MTENSTICTLTGGSGDSSSPSGKKNVEEGKKEMKSQRKVEYQEMRLIARSGQGDAWKAMAKEADGTGREVVVKVLRAPFHSPAAAKYTLRELVLLSSLKHPNLISLYDIRIPARVKPVKKFDQLHLVTEYFGPTLHDREAEKKRLGKVWSHQELSFCLMQILCGVRFLHESGIVHRDLKPSNVVMDARGNLKILDYGIARDILPMNLTPEAGTPFYRAPEIFLGINSYDKKVDLWSVGCILGELVLGRVLFTGNSLASQWTNFVQFLGSPPDLEFLESLKVREQNRAIVEGVERREPVDWAKLVGEECVPKLLSQFLTIENLRQLLASMLVLDPGKRADAKEALENPYFDIYRGFLGANLLAKAEKVYDFEEELKMLQKGENSLDKWKEMILEKVAAFKKSASS